MENEQAKLIRIIAYPFNEKHDISNVRGSQIEFFCGQENAILENDGIMKLRINLSEAIAALSVLDDYQILEYVPAPDRNRYYRLIDGYVVQTDCYGHLIDKYPKFVITPKCKYSIVKKYELLERENDCGTCPG